MHTLRKLVYGLVYLAVVVVIVSSLLSLLVDIDHRYLKMLDFPRVQFFWAAVAGLILLPMLALGIRGRDVIALVGLVAAGGIQASYLVPYTPLTADAVPVAPAGVDGDDAFDLVVANVKMENREAGPLLDYLGARRPDVILAMETDAWWEERLAPFEQEYPYGREVINELAYGMTLYSRLPLRDLEVHYRQNENVPSISAIATLPSGQEFVLHAVHPVPPTRFDRLPDNAGEREVALLQVGEAVAESTLPSVVMGDFNDVAWAATGRLTGSNNLLYDVRVGRGIYSSFDANNALMRWPLDHVLVTEGWAVGALERGPDVGSDHFPLYAELVWLGRR